MRRSLALAALLVILLGSLAFVGTSTGHAPPERLCAVCGDPLAETETGQDIGIDPGRSTLSIQVFENGSSRWTERAFVGLAAATRLRENRSARRSLFEEATSWRYHDLGPRAVDTRIAGRTLVVTYRVDDVASQGVGDILLFDAFHEPREHYRRAADEIVVRGPRGTTVTNDPPEAVVENGAAVWRDAEAGQPRRPAPTSQTYVAFGPGSALQYEVATALTIAGDVGPTMLWHALFAGLLVTILWGLGSLALVASDRQQGGRWTPSAVRTLLVWLVVIYGLVGSVALFSVGFSVFSVLVVIAALAVGSGIFYAVSVAAGAPRRRHRWPVARYTLALGWALAVIPVLLTPLRFLTLWGPILFWVSLGAARPGWQRASAVLGLLVVPTVALLPATPIGGFAPLFTAVVLGTLAFLTLPLAIVLFFLGRFLTTRAFDIGRLRGRFAGSDGEDSPDSA